MKKTTSKLKIFNLICLLAIIFQVIYFPVAAWAEQRATDDGYTPEEVVPDLSDDEVGGDEAIPEYDSDPSVWSDDFNADALESSREGVEASQVLATGFDTLPTEDASTLGRYQSPSKYSTNDKKVVLSGPDERKLEQMRVAASVIPTLQTDPEELALVSGKSVEELITMQREQPIHYRKLAIDNQKKINNNSYIRDRLLTDPTKLAEFLGLEVGEVIDQLESDRDFLSKKIDSELANSIDKRVISTLAYLVRPKAFGGAGHYKIKVERITKGYDTENKKGEREDLAIREDEKNNSSSTSSNSNKDQTIEAIKADDTNVDTLYDPNDNIASNLVHNSQAIVDVVDADGNTSASILIGDNELEPETVSAHFSGQAVDISEVDDIRCTLIEKKRIGSDKKTAKTPQPIKLQYQTQAGYDANSGEIDASYNEMFMSASKSALENMFAAMNLDASDISNQEINNFSDISEAVGKAVFGTAIDAPLKDIWNNNLDDMLRMTGGALLADNLKLSREPFLDSSIDSTEELTEAVGRAYIEKNLNLPYGSLKGETKDDILKNIGLSRIAEELRLPKDALNSGLDGVDTMNKQIGSRIVEWEFGFPEGSFLNKDNLSSLISSAGRSRLDSFFKDPAYIDQKLGLTNGTTESLKDGRITINDFITKTAGARLLRSAYAYPNYTGGEGCSVVSKGGFSFERICSSNKATVDGNKSNWRDEMMGLPEGTIDGFLSNGNVTAIADQLKTAGIDAITKMLEKSDTGRSRLTEWFKNPTPDFTVTTTDEKDGSVSKNCLAVSNYDSIMRLRSADLLKIFTQDGESRGIFKRLGKSLMSYALKPDGQDLKLQNETQNILPNLNVPTAENSFYTSQSSSLIDTAKNIKDVVAKARESLSKASNDSAKAGIEQLNSKLEAEANNLDSAVNSLNGKTDSQEIMDANNAILDSFYRLSAKLTDASKMASKYINDASRDVSAAVYKLENVGKLSYEISVSSKQSDFRFEDINIKDIDSNLTSTGSDTYMSKNNLALLLSGRINIANFLKSMGSSRLGSSIDLPSGALMYVAKAMGSGESENTNMGDTLIRSVALSIFEDVSGLDLSKITADDLKDKLSVDDLVSLFVNKLNISNSKAKSTVASALNLRGYNLDELKKDDFGSWAKASSLAEQNDLRLNLPKGTTQKFVQNKSLGKYDSSLFSKNELQEVSNSLGISEASLKSFIAKKEGAENPVYNKVYYKSYAPLSSDESGESSNSTTSGYFYNDKTGVHKFKTYDEADKYRANHSSDEYDYLEDISNGLSKAIGGSSSDIKNQLDGFLNSKDKYALGDDSYKNLEKNLYNKFGIARDTIARLFGRNGNGDSTGSVDFLSMLGNKYLSKNVLPQINEDMGSDLDLAKLDANDLVKVFNGQGRDILSKVGAYLTDKEMGTKPGTILEIMNTNNSAAREELIKSNAFELLGNALGIKGLNFENVGTVATKFGLGKIESVLGLPSGTFKGNNLNEVIDNISPFDLIKSFNLPVSDQLKTQATEILKSLSNSSSGSKSFADQLSIINTFRQSGAFEKLAGPIKDQISQLSAGLKSIATSVLSDESLVTGDPNAALSSLRTTLSSLGASISSDILLGDMLEGFRGQIKQIETSLKLSPSTLISGLLGTAGINVATIVTDVSKSILQNDSSNSLGNLVANVLGIGNATVSPDSIRGLLSNLRNSLEPDDFGVIGHINLGSVGDSLKNLFSSNFDDKAGFNFGTIKNIIENPGKAFPILLEQGLAKLDAQFGTTDSGLMKRFGNINLNALSGDWSSLLSAGVDLASTLNSSIVPIVGRVTDAVHIAESISDTAVRTLSNETNVLKNITETVMGRTTTRQEQVPAVADIASFGTALKNTLGDVFKGDFRPLAIVSAINSVPSVVGSECKKTDGSIGTCLSVPDNFRLNIGNIFGSVYGEVFGDGGAIDRIQSQAVQWLVESTNSGTITEDVARQIEAGTFDVNTFFSSTESSAMVNPDSATYANDYANLHFPVTALSGAFTSLSSLSGDLLSKATTIATQALSNFQGDVMQTLKFKAMDCSAYKDNPLTPLGFAASMLSGNAFDRVNMLTGFLGKWFGSESGLSDLTSIFGDKAQAILNIFNSGVKLDIPSIASSFGLDLNVLTSKLDSILTDKAPTILGINLGEGIAGNLLSFIQTGNLSLDGTGIGKIWDCFKDGFSIDGVVGLVGGWADEKLGLPSGTTAAIYATLSGSATAMFAYAGVVVTGPLAIVAQIVLAKIQEALTKLITKLITQIFGGLNSKIEESLGLVPGSLTQFMTMSYLMGAGIAALVFIITNLFSVYKTLLVCTADGYYPTLESPPDPKYWDNGNLGTFDGLKSDQRKAYYVKAAQYKADRLIKDVLEMSDKTGDSELVPVQIMTGRKEDVEANVSGVNYAICPKVESSGVYDGTAICKGWNSRSGLWDNPQTTAWTHIGF